MKKIYKSILLLSLVLSGLSIKAQVLLSEAFTNTVFPPAGWTNVQTAGTGTINVWDRQTAGTNPICSPYSAPAMARFNSYNYSSGVDAILVTPAISFTTAGTKSVSFYMYRDNGYSGNYDSLSVYVNTTSSITATAADLGTINRSSALTPTVSANGWYQYTFNVPATFSTATNYIIFKAHSQFGNDIYLDNIIVSTPAPNDVGVTALLSPSVTNCFSSAEKGIVTIKNFGTLAASNFPVKVIMSGAGTGTLNGTYAGILAPNASASYTLPGTLNMSSLGTYSFICYTSLAGDGNATNDTITGTRTSSAFSISVTGNNSICSGISATLTASGVTTYTWNTGANTPSISVTPTATSVYTVTGSTASGCTATPVTFSVGVVSAPMAGTTISTNTLTCIGQTIGLSLNGSTPPTLGLTYQWQNSPNGASWTSIPSATAATALTTNTALTYYQSVLTCGSNTASSVPVTVMAVSSITNSTSYFEGFEGITTNDQLPNCSWSASNLPTICKTYTAATGSFNQMPKTGSKYASFRWGTNTAGDYFYSNGIQLNSGVTYSASVGYITDGATGWTNFSLLYGTSQSTTGLVSIASATGNLQNTTYTTLANTFTVPSNGIYYIAVMAIGNGVPWYLSWDDLSILAPCTVPSLTVASSSSSICAGSAATYTASGATSYTWSTGSNTSTISVTPTISTTYSLTGSNGPGCANSKTVSLTVNSNPTVTSVSNTSIICLGNTATLTAGGATSYTWNTGATTSVIAVSPTITTTYTVTGTNTVGCAKTSTITQSVAVCTSLNKQVAALEGLSVYPNPGSGVFTIELNNSSLKTVEVTDLTGRIILSEKNVNGTINIDISSVTNGVYFVKIQSRNAMEVVKVIKQ